LIKQIEQANKRKRVQIECAVWHLDVGLAHPHERRNHEGFDCSSIKVARELGSDRREPGRSLSGMGVVYLKDSTLSTKGSGCGNL